MLFGSSTDAGSVHNPSLVLQVLPAPESTRSDLVWRFEKRKRKGFSTTSVHRDHQTCSTYRIAW
jgi:hypothetical protein